jgi:pyruvate carboxylase
MKFTPKIISKKLFGQNKKGDLFMVDDNEYIAEFDKKECVHVELKSGSNLVLGIVFHADINEDQLLVNTEMRNQFERL